MAPITQNEHTLGIVIVTHNSAQHITKCIQSLTHLNTSEIHIIDTASTDNTLSILTELQQTHLKLHVHVQEKNIGFTQGCNLGARIAKSSHLLFLNPDTELITQEITADDLLKEVNPKYIVGFKYIYPHGALQHSYGYFPTLKRIVLDRIPYTSRHLGILERRDGKYNQSQKVDWVSWSGALVAKDTYLSLGGLNERIFMYGEDIDFCYRAHKAGITTVYNPVLCFSHEDTGKTEPTRQAHKYFSMRKGLYLFLCTHRSRISTYLYMQLLKLEAYYLRATRKQHDWQKYTCAILDKDYA